MTKIRKRKDQWTGCAKRDITSYQYNTNCGWLWVAEGRDIWFSFRLSVCLTKLSINELNWASRSRRATALKAPCPKPDGLGAASASPHSTQPGGTAQLLPAHLSHLYIPGWVLQGVVPPAQVTTRACPERSSAQRMARKKHHLPRQLCNFSYLPLKFVTYCYFDPTDNYHFMIIYDPVWSNV